MKFQIEILCFKHVIIHNKTRIQVSCNTANHRTQSVENSIFPLYVTKTKVNINFKKERRVKNVGPPTHPPHPLHLESQPLLKLVDDLLIRKLLLLLVLFLKLELLLVLQLFALFSILDFGFSLSKSKFQIRNSFAHAVRFYGRLYERLIYQREEPRFFEEPIDILYDKLVRLIY